MMGLVRNYRRIGWLIIYLYGASPAFCRSFRPAGHPRLKPLDGDTWYGPYSTSLRMSDMGYRNSTQARLSISVNSLDEYVDELAKALTTREPKYEEIGVSVDGVYRQLSANVLQLENEYYSSIRPKPVNKSPRLIAALRSTGVEYVEVRTLDLNPFAHLGVTEDQARFIEVLLAYCLLEESPPISAPEQGEIDRRELEVAWEGRKPALRLSREGGDVALRAWALEIVDELEKLADLIDGKDGPYAHAVAEARVAVLDAEETVSARVMQDLEAGRRSFFEWALEIAERYRQRFLGYEFQSGRLAVLEDLARESLREARALEAADAPPFDEFLRRLLSLGMA